MTGVNKFAAEAVKRAFTEPIAKQAFPILKKKGRVGGTIEETVKGAIERAKAEARLR